MTGNFTRIIAAQIKLEFLANMAIDRNNERVLQINAAQLGEREGKENYAFMFVFVGKAGLNDRTMFHGISSFPPIDKKSISRYPFHLFSILELTVG